MPNLAGDVTRRQRTHYNLPGAALGEGGLGKFAVPFDYGGLRAAEIQKTQSSVVVGCVGLLFLFVAVLLAYMAKVSKAYRQRIQHAQLERARRSTLTRFFEYL